MGWIKKLFASKEKKAKLEQEEILNAYRSEKQIEKAEYTARKEAWVDVLKLDVDAEELNLGSFELDWNEYFVTRLMRFGYQGKTDKDIVDQWFTDVCRNVALETYQQAAADRHPVKSRNLGDGKREYE